MARYSIETTDAHEEAIAFYVGKNSAPDAATLIQQVSTQYLDDLVLRAAKNRKEDLAQRVRNLTDARTLGAIQAVLDSAPVLGR